MMAPAHADRSIAWATHHGGGLDAAVARFGGERADWLDLSTGINPVSPSLPSVSPAAWTRLPEATANDALIRAARTAYGVAPSAGLVAAPGSQALISLLPFCLPPDGVAVVGPTYGEHAGAFRAAGHRVIDVASPEEVPEAARTVVVVNPNNPDGRRFRCAKLEALRARLAARGGLLVVDEAFADAEPGESMAPVAGVEGLLVHRSFGKFFGLAGLRLGFAVTTPALAATLSERLGPWAVSGPALAIGAALLGDADMVAATRARLIRQAEARDAAIAATGCGLVGRTACFATLRHAAADRLFTALCRRRILTRPFAHNPDWLRLGNPADEAEVERLRDALPAAVEEIGGAS